MALFLNLLIPSFFGLAGIVIEISFDRDKVMGASSGFVCLLGPLLLSAFPVQTE